MSVYADSGLLVKLYIRETNSDAAAQALRCHQWLPLNGLQELEVRNAFRALEGRSIISDGQRAAAEHYLELDCVEGRLQRRAVAWTEVFQHAMQLSRNFTGETLARSLDILHVAAALRDSCSLFITGDARQERFAQYCGLQVERVR